MAVANNQLFISTEEVTRRLKPALTTYFSVYIPETKEYGGVSSKDINIFAYEAVLPGTSFEIAQNFGDRQGITESYPVRRIYPPIDVSFYVNIDYNVIKYFENWMQSIFEFKSGGTRYGRFNYPETYETNITITKFERDYRKKSDRLSDKGSAGSPEIKTKITYDLINAFPTNIISLPVSYSQTDVLKTTITFNYDLYSYRGQQN